VHTPFPALPHIFESTLYTDVWVRVSISGSQTASKGSSTGCQGIRGYISVTDTLKFTYFVTSGGTRRCPGWEIEKADIWNRMEGQRLDRIDVICITATPQSPPSRLMRFRIVDTWIPFTSQRIVRITESTLTLGVGTRNCRLQWRDLL